MHIHSFYSDGTDSPMDIVIRAKNFGLEFISLTDHNNFSGVPKFLESCDEFEIEGVAGVEIDSILKELDFNKEILGYFPDGKYENTQKLVSKQIKRRIIKISHYLSQAREEFNDETINSADFMKFRTSYIKKGFIVIPKNLTLMKPNVFEYLKTKKSSEFSKLNYKSFKYKYFLDSDGPNWNGDLDEDLKIKPKLDEVIKVIKSDGGFAVIPHPLKEFSPLKGGILDFFTHDENKNQLYRFFKYCKDIGVDGVELYYYDDFEKDPLLIKMLNDKVTELGIKFDLIFTYGSDCHGTGSHHDTLGKFSGEFKNFSK